MSNEKLYAWTIIGFRESKNRDVSYGNYLFYSRTAEPLLLLLEIQQMMDEKFPETEGWFETHYLIQEIDGEYNNGSVDSGYKLPLYRLN